MGARTLASLRRLRGRSDAIRDVLAVSLGCYVVLRLASFVGGPLTVTDTASYRRAAAVPLWNPDFYAGERGWTVPLFYKLAPGDGARVAAQLALSIACWALLAAVVAQRMRRPVMRPVAFVAVLLFSLSFEIIAWDSLLLSESLSLSLAAALVAGWLAFVERPAWSLLALVLAATLLWVGTRDTNAYAALFTLPLVAAWAALRRHGRPIALAALAGVGLVAVAAALSASAGERWLAPLDDSIRFHVLSDPDARAWFVERGMPAGSDPGAPEYRRWLREDGRSTYVRFLVTHPLRTVAEPLRSLDRLDELLAPDLARYPADVRVTLPVPLADVLFPPTTLTLLFSLVVAAAAAIVAGRGNGIRAVWGVPAALALVSVPHTFLVWHASGQEFGRHSLLGVVGLRLGALVLALLALDSLLSEGRQVAASPAPTARSLSRGR